MAKNKHSSPSLHTIRPSQHAAPRPPTHSSPSTPLSPLPSLIPYPPTCQFRIRRKEIPLHLIFTFGVSRLFPHAYSQVIRPLPAALPASLPPAVPHLTYCYLSNFDLSVI
ncbi:hypothetical protein E2C01_069696 [Portunus trituberculatus]|uniref:Uncharacterized protein n=1 Tax=Portunus trituberculatus TaxID=210409 RepID=A0A5B7HS82_PORTR|nr:hypothetical protein [Portunus trituberculatus]